MTYDYSIGGKWLELLSMNCAARVAFLYNPATATYAEYYLRPFKTVAESLSIEAISSPVHDVFELKAAVATQARRPNGALIVMPDTFTDAHCAEITSLAVSHHLPAVCPFRF